MTSAWNLSNACYDFNHNYHNYENLQNVLLRRNYDPKLPGSSPSGKLTEYVVLYVANIERSAALQSTIDFVNFFTLSYQGTNKLKTPRSVPSVFKTRIKFNGFFFGINLQLIAPVAFEVGKQLFDPADIMVGQEDRLVLKLLEKGIIPKMAMSVFVFHFKAITTGYAASKNPKDHSISLHGDERDKLSYYHRIGNKTVAEGIANKYVAKPTGLLQTVSDDLQLSYPTLYSKYFELLTVNEVMIYPENNITVDQNDNPSVPARIEIAFAISDPIKNPSAGDIFTAQELAEALESKYNVRIRYLHRGPNWYQPRHLKGVDILISFLDQYELPKAIGAYNFDEVGVLNYKSGTDPNLVTIAWMRNWFNRWLSRPWIGNYDLLFVSSLYSQSFFNTVVNSVGLPIQCFISCPTAYIRNDSQFSFKPFHQRTKAPVEILRLATNTAKFFPAHLQASTQQSKYATIDYVFSGSYFNVYRSIMEFDPADLPEYNGMIVGTGWKNANVSVAWKNIAVGRIPYTDLPEVYRSVKIVIDDANHVTSPWGSTNSRVYDALASGALVITNGKLGIQELFPLVIIPTYNSGKELAKIIRYYLVNQAEREAMVKIMINIIQGRHTYLHRADEFANILGKYGIQLSSKPESVGATTNSTDDSSSSSSGPLIRKKQRKNKLINYRNATSVCVGIAASEKNYNNSFLFNLVHGLNNQFSSMPYQSFDYRIILMDSDKFYSNDYYDNLQRLVDTANRNHKTYKGEEGQNLTSANAPTMKVMLLAENNNPFPYTGQTPRLHENAFLGYDTMDKMIEFMLYLNRLKQQELALNLHKKIPNNGIPCEWIIVTSSNKMYDDSFISYAHSALLNAETEVVTWRKKNRFGAVNELKRKSNETNFKQSATKDISTIAARAHVYQRTGVKLLPDAIFTPKLNLREHKLVGTLIHGTDRINHLKKYLVAEQGTSQ